MVKFSRICRAVFLALLLSASPGHAGDRPFESGPAASPIDPKMAPPSELLEFLGDWDAGDEDWVGPEFFENLDASDREQIDDPKDDSKID